MLAVTFWGKLDACPDGTVFKTVGDVFKRMSCSRLLTTLVGELAGIQLALDLPAPKGADATAVSLIKRYAAYTYRKCSRRSNRCGLCFTESVVWLQCHSWTWR